MSESAALPAGMDARLLSFLSEESLPANRVLIRVRFAGRTVTLEIQPREPVPGRRQPRTKCEVDCLAVLSDGVARTRREIGEALEAGGKLWGESWLSQTLATLVSDGLLTNSRRGGGYRLVE